MKRFTETDKWRDSWFRKLSPRVKLGFLYLCDSVDNAGVWDADFELADFCIGEKVDWDEVKTEMGDRIEVLESGKWLLTRFVAFQYGELSPDCKPHAHVMRLVEAHGIRVLKGYSKGIHTHKDKDKDKDQDKESPETMKAALIYDAYPKHVGKQDAIKAIIKASSKVSFDRLLDRASLYASAVARWPNDDRQYIPHPATWFNRGSYEDDPATWERGGAEKVRFNLVG